MKKPAVGIEAASAESLVGLLAGRLNRHVLWDFLFVFAPPLFAFGYVAIIVNHLALISRETLILAVGSALGITLLLGILRYRLKSPPVPTTARLIDERVEGKDRFVTLATIDPSLYSSSLIARLRREAANLQHRISLKKDFPYRIKRSFFASLIGTLAVILLFHLLAVVFSPTPRVWSIRELAQEVSRVPHLAELAEVLGAVAAQLGTERLSVDEKRLLIEDLLKRVEQMRAALQQQGDGDDLLGQVTDALRRLEQGLGKDQNEGGGGITTNLPEDGEGEGKDSGKGGKGDAQGELSAVEGKDLKGGKFAQMKGQEEGEYRGEGQQGRADRLDKPGEEKKEIKNQAEGKPEQKGGTQQGKGLPSGKEPERFLRPGEGGEQGIKGARFITVQLPETQMSDSPGQGSAGKRVGLKPRVPISNVPMRGPDSQAASAEKQPLPLEYRAVIR